ncbi:MAG: hypothetical protein HFH38_14065 [Lachnospiraceae bacterium]|jgi:outer membrane lipoprotein-sorting protein|nr:hypothetical protein [Lachnospiraceae bacterium]
MKKMMERMLCMILIIIIFWGGAAVTAPPMQAEAAAEYKTVKISAKYSAKDRTVGRTTFEFKGNCLYAVQNGRKTLLVSASGKSKIDGTIVTNGTSVYYTEQNGKKVIVHYISSIGKKEKKVFSLQLEKKESFHLGGYYSGKLYYSKGDDSKAKGGSSFYRYSIKAKKNKLLIRGNQENCGNVEQRQRYICIRSSVMDKRDGDRLLVFDAKTETFKTISKKSGPHMMVANMLFYVEVKKNLGGFKWRIAVKSCRLDGSAKKTQVKTLDVRCDGKVTIKNNAITYTDIRGHRKTKRFGLNL